MSEKLSTSMEDQSLQIRNYLAEKLAEKLAEYPLEDCSYASMLSGVTLLLAEVLALSLSGHEQDQDYVEGELTRLLHNMTTGSLVESKAQTVSPGSFKVN